MQQAPGESQKPTWPWDVYKAGDGTAPANLVRYEHTTKLAISMIVLLVLVGSLVGAARSLESEMLTDVEAAKLAGFPQLPPGYGSSARIAEFVDEWNLNAPGAPSRREIDALSERVGEYGMDTSLYNLGISVGVIAVFFVSAVAYSRALNNLRALGHEFAVLASGWAFAVWFIPVLGFVVPWKMVARILKHARAGEGTGTTAVKLVVFLSWIWGVAWIGFWLLNPFSVAMFMRTGNIDEWIRRIETMELMLVWLPISIAVNAVVLAMISFKQRKRYRQLDALSKTDI